MRDFNIGDLSAGRDINFIENSNIEHKLLVNCSTDELLQERPFRLENIAIEQGKKVRRLIPLYAVVAVLVVTSSFLAMTKGRGDLLTFLIGSGSLFLGFLSLKATLEPNQFQAIERAAVSEINQILKQRRVE